MEDPDQWMQDWNAILDSQQFNLNMIVRKLTIEKMEKEIDLENQMMQNPNN